MTRARCATSGSRTRSRRRPGRLRAPGDSREASMALSASLVDARRGAEDRRPVGRLPHPRSRGVRGGLRAQGAARGAARGERVRPARAVARGDRRHAPRRQSRLLPDGGGARARPAPPRRRHLPGRSRRRRDERRHRRRPAGRRGLQLRRGLRRRARVQGARPPAHPGDRADPRRLRRAHPPTRSISPSPRTSSPSRAGSSPPSYARLRTAERPAPSSPRSFARPTRASRSSA